MENNENVYNTLRALLDNPDSRESVINFVENYKGDAEKRRKVDLIVEEIYNYFKHLKLVSEITGKTNGDATKYSVFSFGDAAGANYLVDEEGNLIVNVDFSTQVSRYPGETDTFDRKIDLDFVDFDAVREGLLVKHGIEFGMSYKEEQYTNTEWGGSGDMEASYDMTHYNIDSHIWMSGKVNTKDLGPELGIGK